MTASGAPVDDVVEHGPFTPLQKSVVTFCFVLNMLDGMDVVAISFAAPLIASDWRVDPAALGIVFSAALLGMTLGAIFISPWTDRIGRRNMILVSLAIVSVGMIATAFARSVPELIAMRLVAGLGIGSMLASLTSMVSEYAPPRHRNFCIITMQAGYPIGAIVTGFLSAWILPEFGWRPLFAFAGAVSVIALPLVWWLMPESLAFLATRRPLGALERTNVIRRRMGHAALAALPQRTRTSSGEVGLAGLLDGGRRRATAILWLAFGMSFATLYFLVSWVVKLAVESGLALEHAIYAGVALNLGGFCGSVTLGYVSRYLGLRRMIAAFFCAASGFCVLYGFAVTGIGGVLLLIFTLMYFTLGAFTGLYAVAARLYPTAIRTTGVGWAIGIGRGGAILGPAAAGFILAAGVPISWTFAIFALPLVAAAAAVLALPASLDA